jgi:NhaD family Na+/H+ antiporter
MEGISFYHVLMIATFIIGYLFITIEHITRINKTSVALLMAILCWTFQFISQSENQENNLSYLSEHLSNISQVVFFLLCALTVVEIISIHKGFHVISSWFHIKSKRKLLWVIGCMAFLLSSILDNLTTTIILIVLLQKLIQRGEDRLLLGGAVVIAANAGGVWTPIGDVTTTMLWIGGQLSTFKMIGTLAIPSVICLLSSLICLTPVLKGEFDIIEDQSDEESEPESKTIFWLGIAALIFVPIFKVTTGLPPFMGIILGLAVLWLYTDVVHSRHEGRDHLRVPLIMTNIDVSAVLFFLGILLAIDALQTAGILHQLASWMDQTLANPQLIAIAIGLASGIVDNVPLVAAVMGMYDLVQYPMDSSFWNAIAYCAGTGGSILVIGSAAGVAFMGLERVQFFWYAKRIGLAALVGYFAGIGAMNLLN